MVRPPSPYWFIIFSRIARRSGPTGIRGDAAAAGGAVGASSAIAASEVLQSGDSLAALFCKQANASGPPGVTPRQLTVKSRWQVNLSALCCSGVGIADGAAAVAAVAVGRAPPPSAATALRQLGES